MTQQWTLTGGDIDSEEAMAAIAAITYLLEEEAYIRSRPRPASTDAVNWRSTAKLIAQGLTPIRIPVAPRWDRIERLRRAGRGNVGIVGY